MKSKSDVLNKFAAEQLNEAIADAVLRIPLEKNAEKKQLLIDSSNKLIGIVDQLVEPSKP